MKIVRKKIALRAGLDISPPWIRLLLLKQDRHGLMVEGFITRPLPDSAWVDGKLQQIEPLLVLIKQMMQLTGAYGKPTAIAMPAASVITKRFKIANFLKEEELENQLTGELHRYFPDIAAQLCFDFVKLGPADEDHHDVLLVAARQEQLNVYVSLATQAGLMVRVVDVDTYAMSRAIHYCLKQGGNDTSSAVAIIDVGSAATQFILLQKGMVLFTHQLNWGVTASAEHNVEFIQRDFAQQLKRILQLCYATVPQGDIARCVLSGYGALLPTLPEFVQQQMGVMTGTLNPFQLMSVGASVDIQGLNECAPTLLTCCGLAMRAMPIW